MKLARENRSLFPCFRRFLNLRRRKMGTDRVAVDSPYPHSVKNTSYCWCFCYRCAVRKCSAALPRGNRSALRYLRRIPILSKSQRRTEAVSFDSPYRSCTPFGYLRKYLKRSCGLAPSEWVPTPSPTLPAQKSPQWGTFGLNTSYFAG